MGHIEEGTLLWEPRPKRINESNVKTYMNWLRNERNLSFKSYDALWQWSVDDIEQFWESLWDYFKIESKTPYTSVLSSHEMPGATWFDGATLNYTEHVFNQMNEKHPALIHCAENREQTEVSWEQLYHDTAAFQQTLIRLGVEKGDRVVAYSSHIYETIVAFLATASLGAIWSSASPDFGTQSVIDRFTQIEPKVLIAVDGYMYNGRAFDRMDVVQSIQQQLPSLEATVIIPLLDEQPDVTFLHNITMWQDAIELASPPTLTYTYVPFNDPLWVLFSSGTTGKPKPIVQSQGGILLEHLKATTFHVDLRPGDRFFWFTTTGWMMWNFQIGGLLAGSTIIVYDGSPVYPDHNALWQLAEDTKMNVFGTSASYIIDSMKRGVSPKETFDLRHLTSISSTGSPLPPEGFKWCYDHVKEDLWIASVSGGTDVCTAFILGAPTLPVYAGELQCRGLGAKIESFSDDGEPLTNEVGELVLTKPFPSMPIFFWNDTDGSRLHESYFDMFDGIWRHGDYLKVTDRGTCVIYGRSDATINRGGIRIGTSEIYRAVDQVEEVADSIIVDIPLGSGESTVLLFVVMKEGNTLTDSIRQGIRSHIRSSCSPRHTPSEIYEVEMLPKTLNGKKLEIPVKKILMGEHPDDVMNRDSLANPEALDFFTTFAAERRTE